MYRKDRNHQFTFKDFNQPMGLKMNPNNRWIRKAETIPWNSIEDRYAKLFPSHTGMPAKPLRMALGALLIQKKLGFSDVELVEQITENPYLQCFVGLPGYQDEQPFAPSLMVEFRKRLTDEIIGEINEMIIEYNKPHDDPPNNDGPNRSEAEAKDGSTSEKGDTNQGTMIIDATCAPQNIAFPQDINLLNESRENLEAMIDDLCDRYHEKKPRMYRRKARIDYLNFAKAKRRSRKLIQRSIRKQLQYVRRDLKYMDAFLAEGLELTEKQKARLSVIRKVYSQQKYMYDNNKRTVPDRIVSISQPYIRPIVRGKAKAPTEFGAKLDISVDTDGFIRLEKLSFDAYNESDVLITAAERYYEREGHYPMRILADKIYRNRKNLAFCSKHGIRLSGPKLGRPRKTSAEEKKVEYVDSVDRIEVERDFSLEKRCYGLGLIKTKLDTTTRSSIALSILALNVENLTKVSMSHFFLFVISRFKSVYESLKVIIAVGNLNFLGC